MLVLNESAEMLEHAFYVWTFLSIWTMDYGSQDKEVTLKGLLKKLKLNETTWYFVALLRSLILGNDMPEYKG